MTGLPVPDQAEAFCDTWEMDAEKNEIAKRMPTLMRQHGIDNYYIEFWRLWIQALRNTQPHLLAYLVYMVQRLMVMKGLLRPKGSIYLHCDPTASHYIKIMMDGVFGHDNFRNEIIWKRTSAHSDARAMGAVHDCILYYTASNRFTFNKQFAPYSLEYIEQRYKHSDEGGRRWMDDNLSAKGLTGGGYTYEYKGAMSVWRVPLKRMKELDECNRLYFTKRGGIRIKRYLDEMKGLPVSDVWSDIAPINSQAKERLGYPTQKPVLLIKRIIEQSSNPGEVVFDPFCGCGTTVCAAHETARKWIGCDIAILAIKMIRDILTSDRYRLVEDFHCEMNGIPVSVEQATEIFRKDPFQFEHWIVEHVGGFPTKKTADEGIDGRIYFETADELSVMVLSVKGGTLRPADVRDLRGVLEREMDAELAGFLSLHDPSPAMLREAAKAGQYSYGGVAYDRIQFLTVSDILERKKLFFTPTRIKSKVATEQLSLDI